MATLKEMIEQKQQAKMKAQQTGTTLLLPVVAPLHSKWLERSEVDQAFTPKALERGMEVLSNAHKVKRDDRFSASGLGMCPRRQLFAFAGYEQAPTNLDSADIMRSGTAAHFWMMLEGLSAGWLEEAEIFFRDEHYRLGGTLDGLLWDGSIWEYKSVASSVYGRVTTSVEKQFASGGKKEVGPKTDHLLQLEGYELLTGQEIKSLFYQDRNYGSFYEYRLGADGVYKSKLMTLLEMLNGHENDNTLPPMYDSCEQRVGQTYNECPYRLTCPSRNTLRD